VIKKEFEMSDRLSGKVAVITGAGRNIGSAVTELFVAEGAKVAAVDMDPVRGGEFVDEINAANPGTASLILADVSKQADVQRMVAEAVEAFGRIDILINNVAITDKQTIRECTLEEFEHVVAVTMTSQFLTCKWVAEQMIEQGDGGVMINVGSTSGFSGRNRAIAYTAAKGGVANLMRTIAVQLAPFGIRVNSVVPNKVGSPVGKDEFDPTRHVGNLVGRAGQPEEIAKTMLFLATDDSSFVIGENIFVDGGHTAMTH
jgi:NAD(P)-dependent dehydrogenase (short-subunit alcohol dehydrogenase family)